MHFRLKHSAKFLSICVIFLSACSPSGSNPNKPVEKKVVVWHWMNDRQDALASLAKKYTLETGVPVEFKLFSPEDIYRQKVIAAARAGELPEVFGILGEKKTLASFITAGDISELTSYMEENNKEWENHFYRQALNVTIFSADNFYKVKPGIYGVPIDITLMQFVYNKKLFKDAGLNPDRAPATLDELVSMAKKIKEKTGADGFISGWGESWLLNSLAMEWAINIMGEEKFYQTIAGKVPYTDPDWIAVFSQFSKLKDSGILSSNITTIINKESESAFSTDKSAFSYTGSWSFNVYKQSSANLDYAFFGLPKVSDKFPSKIWGGAGSSFMVYDKSPNKAEAIKFLKWLTQVDQQKFLAKETNNLPAVKGCEAEIAPVLRPLLSDLNNLTHPNNWPANEDYRVTEVFNKGLQEIVMGLKSPEQLAKEVQEVKQRVFKENQN
jgi:ABC-type glycerol-3-phosphate transport system substrate-binding protein